MIEGRIHRTQPINQILLLLMVIVLLYLVADFGRQVVVSRQRQEELKQIECDIESAQEDTRRLEARLDYVQSPQAAEAWAREQGWVKPDEVSVVLIAPPASSSTDMDKGVEEELGPLSHREEWWALFFGEQ
jgi:cell division protein FtsB